MNVGPNGSVFVIGEDMQDDDEILEVGSKQVINNSIQGNGVKLEDCVNTDNIDENLNAEKYLRPNLSVHTEHLPLGSDCECPIEAVNNGILLAKKISKVDPLLLERIQSQTGKSTVREFFFDQTKEAESAAQLFFDNILKTNKAFREFLKKKKFTVISVLPIIYRDRNKGEEKRTMIAMSGSDEEGYALLESALNSYNDTVNQTFEICLPVTQSRIATMGELLPDNENVDKMCAENNFMHALGKENCVVKGCYNIMIRKPDKQSKVEKVEGSPGFTQDNDFVYECVTPCGSCRDKKEKNFIMMAYMRASGQQQSPKVATDPQRRKHFIQSKENINRNEKYKDVLKTIEAITGFEDGTVVKENKVLYLSAHKKSKNLLCRFRVNIMNEELIISEEDLKIEGFSVPVKASKLDTDDKKTAIKELLKTQLKRQLQISLKKTSDNYPKKLAHDSSRNLQNNVSQIEPMKGSRPDITSFSFARSQNQMPSERLYPHSEEDLVASMSNMQLTETKRYNPRGMEPSRALGESAEVSVLQERPLPLLYGLAQPELRRAKSLTETPCTDKKEKKTRSLSCNV